jgi:hypothetical protein
MNGYNNNNIKGHNDWCPGLPQSMTIIYFSTSVVV